MSYDGRDPIFAELDRRIAEEEDELRKRTRAATPPEPSEPSAKPVPPAPPKPASQSLSKDAGLRRKTRGRYRRRVSEIALTLGVEPWKIKRARFLYGAGQMEKLREEGLAVIMEHLRSADR